MARKMKGEHFIIEKASDVPRFLDGAKAHFGSDEYEAKILLE